MNRVIIVRNVDGIKILIDTWWNVNAKDDYTLEAPYAILIDTWWNVN